MTQQMLSACPPSSTAHAKDFGSRWFRNDVAVASTKVVYEPGLMVDAGVS